MRCMVRSSTVQRARTYPHGKVNEPIPAASHIYGGAWYMEGVKRWGVPIDLERAEAYHQEAVRGIAVPVPPAVSESAPEPPEPPAVPEPPTAPEPPKAPRKKKPAASAAPTAPAVPRRPNKKAPETPQQGILLPTHVEIADRHDADGYDVEIVTLTRFEHEGMPYYRSATNKLYRALRSDRIGEFVGRYDPMTDQVCRDVEDSDREE